ncbi:MAG: hypothetical protein LBQ41_03185 [Candidatus Ancillula sp.]|nr:hypothetical protein [Candidatus Ancillula sp.]
MKKFCLLSALCLVLSLSVPFGLSSCGSDESAINDTKVKGTESGGEKNVPVLQVEQITPILSKIVAKIDEAAAQKNLNLLDERVQGAEKPLMTTKLRINANDLQVIPSIKQYIVTNTKSWPRTIFLIGEDASTKLANKLYVLQQNNVRDNYKVSASVTLFDSQQLPKFDVPNQGSANVKLTETGYESSIPDILTKYSDLLSNGTDSHYANDFAIDQLQTQIRSAHQIANDQLSQLGGQQSEVFNFVPETFSALKTYDGGALCVAEFKSTWVRSLPGNFYATTATEAEKTLFGDSQRGHTIEADYITEVLMYIPKKVDNAKNASSSLKVFGAERFPVEVRSR